MIEEAASYITSRINNLQPDIGLILGSGLGEIAESIEDKIVIPYTDIPHFPKTTISGHKGQLVIGQIGQHTVMCLQGRFHLYEGHKPQLINMIIEILKVIGIKELIITNAAGSLNKNIAPGNIMLISDHINMSGTNPLIGVNNEKYGPRFPSMTEAYAKHLREKMKQIADSLQIPLHEGTYLMVMGPNFETKAEINALRILGADAVGMSTVPEVICANRCGIKVLGLSVITNYGAGMTADTLSHEETLAQGQKACAHLSQLIYAYLQEN